MITPLGLGDDNAAGGAQPAHHWCIGIGRWRLREYLRARARRLPGYVEQVLDGDNDAIERAERNARPCARVGRICLRTGSVCVDGEASARALTFRVGDAR